MASLRRRLSGFLACAALSTALGCGGDDGGSAGTGSDGKQVDDEKEEVPCDPKEYPSYTPGLEATKGDVTVRLVEVDPEPPRQLQKNNWTVEVVDGSGEPLQGASITRADSWMIVHNHGGRHPPKIEKGASAGSFVLNDLDFRMRGPWQVRMDVKKSADAAPVQVVLQVCVE